MSGSCQAPENQPNVDIDLRPGQPRGRTWTGTAAAVKARALDGVQYAGTFATREGHTACLGYSRTWTLDPGHTLTVPDVVWRVRTPNNSAYDGTGTVRAVFRWGSITLDARTGAILARDLPGALAPPDAQAPAAGACQSGTDAPATIELNPDVPLPRCLIVRPDQPLRVVNTTARFGSPGQVVTVQLGTLPLRRLAPGASTTYDALGDLLVPGVHRLKTSLYAGSGPEIWLKP